MKQFWFCEACRAVGFVEPSNRTGAIDGAFAVADDHRERSPHCGVNSARVRVVNLALVLGKVLPPWVAEEIARLY